MFAWYELRTPDLVAAQQFYAVVLGCEVQADHDGVLLFREGEAAAELSVLPDEARRRGAPAHWLGHLLVDDLDMFRQRLVAMGGEPRGPVRTRSQGARAVFRDPFGAVVGLSTDASRLSHAVAWHELHVLDDEAALATYAALFGWHKTEVHPITLPEGIAHQRTFARRALEAPCGATLSTANRPQLHPHWAFYFSVADLDSACAHVTAQGGEVFVGPRPSARGPRFAVCHDPQGAEFSLLEDHHQVS